jgi:myo-inositol-hexaphosphate 3-phosphohydrolase
VWLPFGRTEAILCIKQLTNNDDPDIFLKRKERDSAIITKTFKRVGLVLRDIIKNTCISTKMKDEGTSY